MLYHAQHGSVQACWDEFAGAWLHGNMSMHASAAHKDVMVMMRMMRIMLVMIRETGPLNCLPPEHQITFACIVPVHVIRQTARTGTSRSIYGSIGFGSAEVIKPSASEGCLRMCKEAAFECVKALCST